MKKLMMKLGLVNANELLCSCNSKRYFNPHFVVTFYIYLTTIYVTGELSTASPAKTGKAIFQSFSSSLHSVNYCLPLTGFPINSVHLVSGSALCCTALCFDAFPTSCNRMNTWSFAVSCQCAFGTKECECHAIILCVAARWKWNVPNRVKSAHLRSNSYLYSYLFMFVKWKNWWDAWD